MVEGEAYENDGREEKPRHLRTTAEALSRVMVVAMESVGTNDRVAKPLDRL